MRTALREVIIILLSSAILGFSGCAPDQLLVLIDSDTPTNELLQAQEMRLGQPSLPTDTQWSADAIVDTVRVDLLSQDGLLLDVCEFVVLQSASWPLSFGIPRTDELRFLRVRGFQRSLAKAANTSGFQSLCGKQVTQETTAVLSEPLPEVTIDRVAALPPFTQGERAVALRLSLGCMGAVASFSAQQSCVDGSTLPPRRADFFDPAQWEDVASVQEFRSNVALSKWARERPCDSALAPPGASGQAVCVPGGFQIQGDLHLITSNSQFNPTPLRAVYQPPVYIDRTEFTVGRMKEAVLLAKQRSVKLAEPNQGSDYKTSDDEVHNCTWNLTVHGSNDLPVNCVSFETARASCRLYGGDLLTEAEWEFASRGHGRRWPFAWGSASPRRSPRCCHVALNRLPWGYLPPEREPPDMSGPDRCTEFGPAKVGSYRNEGCAEGGDVSIDGLLDLTGNLSELVLDDFRPYSQRCGISDGVTLNPLCLTPLDSQHLVRGGNWYSYSEENALSARRNSPSVRQGPNILDSLPALNTGFRCAYRGE